MDIKSTIAKASELIKSKNLDKAVELLKGLIKTDPNNELALGMLASVYADIHMNDKAIELYERILSVSPKNPLARFQYGLLLYNNQQLDKAIAVWEPALADSSDFMTYYFSGLAHLHQNQTTKAKALLENAKKHMPENHSLRHGLDELLAEKTSIH